MPLTIFYAGNPDEWPAYQQALSGALMRRGIAADITNHAHAPQCVDYIIYAPSGGLSDFTPFSRLKAVLSLWAGVETFQDNPTLDVPLARMVNRSLCDGMAEWVLGHTLRYHLDIERHIFGQDGAWRNDITPPLARDRRVGILGLGALGQHAAAYLVNAGFQVAGWSRHLKSVDGVACYAGAGGLNDMLRRTEILVLLLPQTPATENLLNARTLALLPRGARLLNPGRGALIDDTALLAALKTGHIAHATLDVFRIEPLPPKHPFWAHPNVTVTPHIAAETRVDTAAEALAENIRRGEVGESFLNLVDRRAGY